MSDHISRREALKVIGVVGAAAGAGALLPPNAAAAAPVAPAAPPPVLNVPGEILPLTSTSEVFVPPRGRAYMKFSFDFPEPSVAFGDLRFGFLVFTDENTYGLDASRMSADVTGDTMRLTCAGFVWAGGQEKAPGRLTATFRREGTTIEWDAVVEMERPVKTVTAIVRGVPRGQVSLAAGGFSDRRDNEILGGYTFGAGDLHGPGSSEAMVTPLAVVQAGEQDFFFLSSLDDRVRPKRFHFQPGERAYRVEAIYEHDAWRDDRRVTVPRWRLGRATSFDAAVAPHFAHVERAYKLPTFETRADAPAWMRQVAMVTTLHGQHYTGFVFNDYARQLEILRWMATQIPAERVLVFLAAWDGRYYWDYPNFKVDPRMGGEAGFRRLIGEGRQLGFKMMPMFTTNAANRNLPSWSRIADASTKKLEGNVYNLDWVDWNNDRHQDGWLTYMNLGVASWRNHMAARIGEMIERYKVDAYFLDIVGGHVNSTNGDMHEGTRRLITELRAKYPRCVCVGEMPYDALYEFIPMFHAGGGPRWQKYAHFFQHLSAPAPGRGSSGVHEAGFGRFNEETLNLSPNAIPTLQVVDDTFTTHRVTMAAIIRRAKERAGIA
jgi:hypothetical protein